MDFMSKFCYKIQSKLVATAIAAKYWGPQWGMGLYYGVAETGLGWWLGWTILGPLLFIVAVIISLFPRRFLKTVLRQAADSIVEVATNNSQLSLAPNKLLADISFGKSMARLLNNKILMFNVVAAVFIETAMFNFLFHENSYLQSRFHIPTDNLSSASNEWNSRFLTTILKPFFVAMSVLITGLVIAKTLPSAR